MSTTKTAEEVKKEHIQLLGDELGPLYHALWNELAWLYSKWEEYVELFGTRESRIDLINQAAGYFFKVVQDSLWEDTMLHIARLTDPAKSLRKENLSIQQLESLIDDETLANDVSGLVQIAIKNADFCRDWRNRHIAHKDLALALKRGVEPLKPANRKNVSEAIKSISDVLNAISLHYLDSTTAFELGANTNGALSLLYVLDDGLSADTARKQRIKTSNYTAEDLKIRDL